MNHETPIRVLRDQEARADAALLGEAWDAPETFVYLPERGAPEVGWMAERLSRLPEALRRDHFVLLTSGSTGKPKLVVGRKARAEALARLLHETQRLEPMRATILALPTTYCFAFVNQWLWARVHDRQLVRTPGLSAPREFAAHLREAEAAMICLVGAQLPLLRGALGDAAFPGIGRVNFAGGRFPQESLAQVRAWFPEATIWNNFGCAEAMPRLTQRLAEEGDDAADIGRPLPGVVLEAGEDQALRFRSPFAAVGFVDEAGFRAVAEGDWLETGDLAERDAGGRWRLLGRASEVFKRFGEKIALPTILERVRAARAGEAAAYRETDPAGEEGYVLVLGGNPDKAAARGVLAVFRDQFPRTHWPLRIEGRVALPLLANGKPDVRELARGEDAVELWRQRI